MARRTSIPGIAAIFGSLALLAACGGGSGGNGATSSEPAPNLSCPGGEFESTWEAIQEVIFERHGCREDACHGSAKSGGLDLRPEAAYASLFEVASTSSSYPRLRPGEPTQSYLYLKLKANTEPGSVSVAGSPMPSGLPAISARELEAFLLWIEAGAPETGSVGDSIRGKSEYLEDLLGACLPPATPISIAPLEAPAPGEGVQFRMPPYTLPAGKEIEICVAQYYDFSAVVPPELQDLERGVFYANGSHLRQDPHSHHLVIDHTGLGADWVHDPSFGAWTCKGGAHSGEVCEPTDPNACGDQQLCSSEVRHSVACIGYGPSEGAVNVAGGGIGGAQTAQQIIPPRDGLYTELPIRGIIYYNSHAFNLTSQDHVLNARINFTFALDRRFRSVPIVDIHALYAQAGQPPFTKQHYCAEHVLPQGSELLNLSSHTHKRGGNFTVDLYDGTRVYESHLYSDPVDEFYEPPLRFDDPDPAKRTLTYCADFNNGVLPDGLPDLRLVTRASTMPDRARCVPVACFAGRVGAPCSGAGDDATCDSAPGAGDGDCDACSITPGVTTENEMFVLTGAYTVR